MFSLFCKIRKILTRGITAVVGIDTKLKIYLNYTKGNERQPNRNKDNNDNPTTKTIDECKDGQIQVLVIVHLQKVNFWHFLKEYSA